MKKKKLLWQIPFLLFLIIGTVVIIREQQTTPYQHNEGFIFGTEYHVTYQYDKDLQKDIEAQLKEVDNTFSMFNDQSLVSLFNKNGQVKGNGMFDEVFQLAKTVNTETDGAFDITVAPLVNAWGFGFKHEQMPTAAQVKELKSHIGMEKVALQGSLYRRTDPKTMLDFSAIAKGFGSDVVARFLESKGINNFMIEIGGEIVTRGINAERVPWRIGVTKPTDDSLNTNQEIQTILNVTDMAMATSGNYRNFYYKGGKKYAHTIDPHTGYPVQHNILSSTVLAKNCATADAYATSFMVLGLNGAQKVLAKHPELMVYFIYDDHGKNKVWFSPNMKEKIMR
ncbi:FAD:protein FMN transferase [Prevotella sp. AGR2160]|uniref:FAD:protein FMN transferase n=1 Tax=Prevotella sp. AGR2160 TaxID=1280674 RepID=UPI0003F4C8D3|nr:FAD:protein FMN transferase [Prevotella sp. AGR2160]